MLTLLAADHAQTKRLRGIAFWVDLDARLTTATGVGVTQVTEPTLQPMYQRELEAIVEKSQDDGRAVSRIGIASA